MLGYYKSVWVTAWRESRARIRGGMREVIQFIIQTGAFLALLFFLPWFGQVQDEARLVLAGVGGLFASAILMFLIELVKAPASMAQQDRSEVIRLGNAFRFNEDAETVRLAGYEIYERWRRTMPAKITHTTDLDTIDQIEREAEIHISKNYGDRELMSYRYGTGYHSVDEERGTPEFYTRRLDAFHTVVLSYSTKAETLSQQFRPDDWKPE